MLYRQLYSAVSWVQSCFVFVCRGRGASFLREQLQACQQQQRGSCVCVCDSVHRHMSALRACTAQQYEGLLVGLGSQMSCSLRVWTLNPQPCRCVMPGLVGTHQHASCNGQAADMFPTDSCCFESEWDSTGQGVCSGLVTVHAGSPWLLPTWFGVHTSRRLVVVLVLQGRCVQW
jgi:hypothetical protein